MLSIIHKENTKEGYKYIITKNSQPFTAYNTNKGFTDFCKRHSIVLEKVNEWVDIYKNKTIIYTANTDIKESYFTTLDQLPPGAKKYTGLSNGSLVDCYYTTNAIYRPNPNCKDIYKPLDIQEHIAYQQING